MASARTSVTRFAVAPLQQAFEQQAHFAHLGHVVDARLGDVDDVHAQRAVVAELADLRHQATVFDLALADADL